MERYSNFSKQAINPIIPPREPDTSRPAGPYGPGSGVPVRGTLVGLIYKVYEVLHRHYQLSDLVLIRELPDRVVYEAYLPYQLDERSPRRHLIVVDFTLIEDEPGLFSFYLDFYNTDEDLIGDRNDHMKEAFLEILSYEWFFDEPEFVGVLTQASSDDWPEIRSILGDVWQGFNLGWEDEDGEDFDLFVDVASRVAHQVKEEGFTQIGPDAAEGLVGDPVDWTRILTTSMVDQIEDLFRSVARDVEVSVSEWISPGLQIDFADLIYPDVSPLADHGDLADIKAYGYDDYDREYIDRYVPLEDGSHPLFPGLVYAEGDSQHGMVLLTVRGMGTGLISVEEAESLFGPSEEADYSGYIDRDSAEMAVSQED